MSRSRPANHPVARIATLSALLASTGSRLVTVLLAAIRDGAPLSELLHTLVEPFDAPALGADRATAVTASVILPFTAALARSSDDTAQVELVHQAWAALPSAPLSQPARRARGQVAGELPLRGLLERGNQGLLVLDKRYCGPRRCFECPVARQVIATTPNPGPSVPIDPR